MAPFFRVLVLGLVVMAIGAVGAARGQAPPSPPIEGNIYSVTYVEVMPPAKADGVALLRRYREATRKEGGNLRCEVIQRIDQPHQFAILEIWKDQKAFEANSMAAATREFRDKLATMTGSLYDERMYKAVD